LTRPTRQELTKSSGNFEVSPETLVPAIQRLANFFKVELTDDQWRFTLLALEGVPRDQLTRGFNLIPVTHTFMPMPAELREACTGVPSRSVAAKGVDDDVTEVNRLWAWLVKWHSWLVEGHRYQLTIAPFSDHPVTHRFRNHSLNDRHGFRLFKVRPSIYEGDDAALEEVREDRRWCRLDVSMPPPWPPLLIEILEGLHGTVRAALQKFAKFIAGQDDHFQRNFEKKGLELMGRNKEKDPLPASRQLSGAVQSNNEPRHFTGIVTFTADDTAGYYSVAALQKAQADGLGIGDEEIEAHAVFLKNLKEIWNAPYPPTWHAHYPPPPGTVFRSHLTSQEEQDAQTEQEFAYRDLLEKRRALQADQDKRDKIAREKEPQKNTSE
jgi:hypothetical protein